MHRQLKLVPSKKIFENLGIKEVFDPINQFVKNNKMI